MSKLKSQQKGQNLITVQLYNNPKWNITIDVLKECILTGITNYNRSNRVVNGKILSFETIDNNHSIQNIKIIVDSAWNYLDNSYSIMTKTEQELLPYTRNHKIDKLKDL